jgi:cyclopropane fatty-acyl-phospholipid synthase-like methyltransferase
MLDNLEEYMEPDLYDAENDLFKDDFNVFVGLKHHGSALDLACGTGRLTIALAKSGLPCIGLDVSESMLERAREKSEGLDISYRQGDMRDFHLNQKFDLITMAGNAFQAHRSQSILFFMFPFSLKMVFRGVQLLQKCLFSSLRYERARFCIGLGSFEAFFML